MGCIFLRARTVAVLLHLSSASSPSPPSFSPRSRCEDAHIFQILCFVDKASVLSSNLPYIPSIDFRYIFSGFIQTNKQTNKQTSVDEIPAYKHTSNQATKTNKQTNTLVSWFSKPFVGLFIQRSSGHYQYIRVYVTVGGGFPLNLRGSLKT